MGLGGRPRRQAGFFRTQAGQGGKQVAHARLADTRLADPGCKPASRTGLAHEARRRTLEAVAAGGGGTKTMQNTVFLTNLLQGGL